MLQPFNDRLRSLVVAVESVALRDQLILVRLSLASGFLLLCAAGSSFTGISGIGQSFRFFVALAAAAALLGRGSLESERVDAPRNLFGGSFNNA